MFFFVTIVAIICYWKRLLDNLRKSWDFQATYILNKFKYLVFIRLS
jgi:hypothetical protein